MRLHRRQFVLGPEPLLVHEDWRAVALAGGLTLSHDPALPVHHHSGRALLGVAVETEASRPAPVEQLGGASAPPDTTTWAGRWILVGDGALQLDAAGTLACFTRRAGGETWASSSAELLRRLAPELPPVATPLAYASGMDWFPPPGSGIDGIDRLLPSQRLRLPGGDREPRTLLPAPPVERSYEELLESLQGRLTTALAALARTPGDRWLPLSGGRDSRTLLAAASAAGIAVRAYTLDYASIGRGDRVLPPRLAAAAGFEHRMLAPAPPDPDRLELWDRHTARHCVDIDRQFFACGQLDPVTRSVLDLGGGVFEAGRCYYHGGLPDALPRTPEETVAAVQAILPSVRPQGLRAWADWVHATADPAVDWRDRLYLEQRVAGWLSAIAQGLDLVGVPRLHVACCAAYLSETLAIPEDVRRTGFHHDHLVRRMAPELAKLPFNPPDSLRARVRRRMAYELEEYRSTGGPRRYVRQRAQRLRERSSARRRG